MGPRLCGVMVLSTCATISLHVQRADAVGVVTFYNDQASFLAAMQAKATLDFEGLATDTGHFQLGTSYHTGAVTFSTSDSHINLSIAGRNSGTAGAPFDSALLYPVAEPVGMNSMFDPGSNITAVGGYLMILASSAFNGRITLYGSSGVLDTRIVSFGSATAGHPHTFYGYTVVGDTISNMKTEFLPGGQAYDNFTYGTVPAPATASLLIFSGLAAARRRR